MDEQRFDAALRALQAGTTRRRGLAGMLGVLLGGTALDASAKGSGRNAGKGPIVEGPCGDGSAADNRCKKNSDCCTKYCAQGACRCKPNYMACTKGEHCCSGSCADGRCDGGAKPAGAACEENFNCQDGLACIDGVCAKSNKAKCSRQTCDGCCDGTVCRAGVATRACGKKGAVCAVCTGSSTCDAGACSTLPQLCPKCSSLTPATCNKTCTASTNWTGRNAFTLTTSGNIIITANGLMAIATETKPGGNLSLWTRPSATSNTWTAAGTVTASFGAPNSLALSADNRTLWVSDSGGDMVFVFTRPSSASTVWTEQTSFSVSSGTQLAPQGIAATADGLTIVFTAFLTGEVKVWTRPDAASTAWTEQASFGSDGSGPENMKAMRGIAISPEGLTVWVADSGNARISVWTRPDAASTAWTHAYMIGDSGPNRFTLPYGLVASCDTLTLYASDLVFSALPTSRVMVWTRPDTASTTWTSTSNVVSNAVTNSITVTPNGLTCLGLDFQTNQVGLWKRGC
jgi:sugar lactone lactonase YvrE